MVIDWLKHNLVAALTAASVVVVAIGGSTAYVVWPSLSISGYGSPNAPDRFTVYADGKPFFDCRLIDLTGHHCQQNGIGFRRQPGDPTRLMIYRMSTENGFSALVAWLDLTRQGIEVPPEVSSFSRKVTSPAARITAVPLEQ